VEYDDICDRAGQPVSEQRDPAARTSTVNQRGGTSTAG
jgi:hypothetical protein